jgi:hypothetical protein
MSKPEDKSDPKAQPQAKAAFTDRSLSDAELEAVAAAGDSGKGDPNQKPPPPPAGKA